MSKWILPFLRQHKGLLILTLVLGLLGLGSGAMLLFISGYLISKSALQPENIMLVYVPIVAVRAFSIGQAVFLYLERLVGHDVVLRIVAKMRARLYTMLEPQALDLHSRYESGDLLGVLSEDIEHLQDFYLRTIFPALLALCLYSVLIIVFGLFDWVFALLLALLLGVIIFLVPLISLFVTRRNHVTLKRGKNKSYRLLTDAVFGLFEWQASGRVAEFLTRFKSEEADMLATEAKVNRWEHIRDGLMHVIVGIVVIAMLIWTGNEASEGQIAGTVIAAFVLMILAVSDSLMLVPEAIERVPAYEDALRRMSKVEIETKIPDVQLNRTEPFCATIHINNVSYRYPNSDHYVLQDVTLTIPKGKKVAILGRSGTGKSTLLKLLTGIVHPRKGHIRIGKEEADRRYVAQAISVLNQKPHLFHTTIRNNIRIGRPEATAEDIWEVVEQAQIESFISSLPEGLDTPMHELGKRFSGGERQRIAFARVLLQATPIVILDEPTIGLDPRTENALLETMFSAAKDKTIIWVTHHLTHIERVDEVIFLGNGQIELQGSHKQLLQTSEKYRALYKMAIGL